MCYVDMAVFVSEAKRELRLVELIKFYFLRISMLFREHFLTPRDALDHWPGNILWVRNIS
jgi:hypothetical protein